MLYRIRKDNSIVNFYGLTKFFENVSIPFDAGAVWLDPLGVDVVEETPKPSTLPDEVAELSGVEQLNRAWKTVWTIRQMTETELAEKAAIDAQAEAERLARPMTPFGFLKRFTRDEIKAIRATAKVNEDLDVFMYLLDHCSEVRRDDPDLLDGLAAMETAGLLTSTRIAEILAL